ncbi:MAG TPA: cation:proton antiporter [Candidatus Methanoperedenaceae archaeon]|nr:cation:proton antiporter [Candidatus Methanoperedenaceae archaeon]
MVFFEVFIWLLLFTAFLALYRAVFGPTTADRIVAVNVIGTKTVVVLVIIGYVYARPYFFDIALLYAILNFIGVLAIAKYLERGKLSE